MSLSSYRISPQIAVSDMSRAEKFYEGKLGLVRKGDQFDGSRTYACGDGTSLHVYESPDHAGKATGTLARFDVHNLENLVDELSANGVTFEQYEEPLKTDRRGILDTGYGRVAWFKDPDANTFALEQV